MPRRIIRGGHALGFWAVFALLGGCISTAGIEPQAQRMPLAPQATALAEQDAAWPAGQWWRAYADPQLNHWVELATQGSPDLLMAGARLREAQAMAGVVEASEALQVQADASLHRRGWPADGFYGPGDLADHQTWDNNAGLGLRYAVDLWGREHNASEQALDGVHVRVAEQRQAQLQLQDNVVRAYILLALNHARLEIVESTLAQQQQILDLAQRRLAGGIGTHLEVSQAQAPLAETHRQIDAFHEAIVLGRHQLAALAGLAPQQGDALKRPTLSLQRALPLPTTLPAQLLGQRPDVVAARWQVAAQARGIAVAHAGFYPNVDLAASLGYMATGGGMLEFLTGSKFSYSVGPAVSLPIFDGGRLRAQLGQATAGYDQAVAHYNQTLVQAMRGIADQLTRRESLNTQQALAAESVAAARKTMTLAQLAFQRGLTDYLTVLNAQTLLWRQQTIEQQVQAARLGAYAELVVALGGGLGAGADGPAESRLQAPSVAHFPQASEVPSQ